MNELSHPFLTELARSHQPLKSEVAMGELLGYPMAFVFSYGAIYPKIACIFEKLLWFGIK